MGSIETIHDELKINGWIEIEKLSTLNELINFASSIGQIIPHPNGQLVNNITPNNGKNAIRGTFSSKFGYGKFPLHTDTAFLIKPVRYILLSLEEASTCKTLVSLADNIFSLFEKQNIKYIERAIFKVKTITKQFYSPLIFSENNLKGFKYDPTCMTPANEFAEKFIEILNNIELPTNEIEWSGNKAILIDNWRVLHGRGEALSNEKRELKRIYIN